MSHIQPGHPPIHAFYVTPQVVNTLAVATATINSSSKKGSAVATAAATKSLKMVQTAAVVPTHNQHSTSLSNSAFASSMPSPVIARLPPFINPPPPLRESSFDNKVDDNNSVSWLAPLLGVLGAVGVLIIAIIFFIRRRKYKLSPRVTKRREVDHSSSRRNQPLTNNKYASWASCSTINTAAANLPLEEEKKSIHMLQPPPAYTTTITSKREKRLTADTLVDEHSLSMLKSQYSPQLAFSPSLVAGEFQQQLDHPPLPNTTNNQQISPSNTLIDNAGVLSDEKQANYYSYDSQQRVRIEMYDPQVNLHDTDYDGAGVDADEFETPSNYPNNQEEKVNVCEGEKHSTADTTEPAHQVIDMNTNKQ